MYGDHARIELAVEEDQLGDLPTNVRAEMEPTTLFGRKYVALTMPEQPAASTLSAGATIDTSQTPVEVYDTFELLVGILDRVDPARVNATLTAVQTGTVSMRFFTELALDTHTCWRHPCRFREGWLGLRRT